MPLVEGTRLGHYEILTPIGQGGMGEVYRARDTTLKRDVALKVLPAAFVRDPERMARFQREAEVLASLDHPNIGPIHGIVDSPDSRALVLALIEGPTLADRIAIGALPPEEAFHVAKQIIEALEYAHDRGVIHRDLKPANVKITPEGVVRVLDFGLAKVLEDEPTPSSSLANSPTLTLGHTRAGVILGTAAYMSPEQAIGRPVDRRSDIFSFGAVLYEMLTGQRAFAGATTPDVLEAVVKSDPDWSKLPAETPATIRTLLRRCLHKDRKLRLQAIGEARIALSNPESQVAAEPVANIQQAPPSKLPWAIAAAAVLALAGLAAWTFYPRPAPRPPDAARFTFEPPSGYVLTDFHVAASQLAVSPDGRYVAFVADPVNSSSRDRTIWIRALGALSAQKLDKTEEANFPFWSPDSKNIGFFAGGKLKRIAVTGGSPINICDAADGEGEAWLQPEGSSEGVILFAPTNAAGIQRVPAAGGVPVPVTKLAPNERGHSFPQFLPDGKRFLYFVRGAAKPGIYVQPLGSEERTFLLETPGRAVFVTPDLLLYLRDNTLLAQHWDWAALKPLGEPVSVTDEVRSGVGNGRNAFSVSSTGVLAYRRGAVNQNRYRWYTRDGKPEGLPLALEPGDYGPIALSPDNQRAVVERRQSGKIDLWLVEFSTGVSSRLTSGRGRTMVPAWSPNSRRIVFDTEDLAGGKPGIYQMVIGSGNDTLVYPSKVPLVQAWTRDGLLLSSGGTVSLFPAPEEPATNLQDAKPRTLAELTGDQFRVSPDGKWVAYETGSQRTVLEVWAAEFPAFTGRRKIASGKAPKWRADGKELIFVGHGNAGVMSVEVKNPATLEIGPPKPVFNPAGSSLDVNSFYAMTRDGQRFLVRETLNTGNEIESIYVILNWPSLLGR